MPRRRRQQQGLERVLGTPALFATAYGNVGSSIYYALGVTAVFALGLTPVVFLIAGLIFAATAATYAEGTVRYPEAGGSSSFARHGVQRARQLRRGLGADARLRRDGRDLGVLRAALPVGLLGAAPGEPLGHRRRRDRDRAPRRRSTSSESARRRASTSCSPSSTSRPRLLLVAIGFVLVFSPSTLIDNVKLGVAPTWSQFFIAIPIAMLAYTGVETVSNLAEEVRDPVRNVPRRPTSSSPGRRSRSI